jgi:streptogramin lyase
MWVGTYSNGTDLYNEKSNSFIHYRHNPNDSTSISSNTINQFFEDSKGNLWICTATGLNIFDRERQTFTSFLHKANTNSISNDRVVCIREDSKGNFWIGTELGLNYLDSKTKQFTSYYVKHGLPGNSIFGILIDEEENLWISTNNGLSVFNPRSNSFKNYAVYDGLQSTEFKKAAYKSSSGEFYFGGTNGFNEFTPGKIVSHPFEPPLVLTGFEVFNRPVPISSDPELELKLTQSITLTDEIQLSYEHNVFSIEFASLNYTSPERKRYSYMLEGFDKEWTSLSPENRVTYTNLEWPPPARTSRHRGR